MNEDFNDLIELSDFYILSQKFNEALSILKKAERIDKLEPKLYYNFGIVYEALNDREKALEAYRLALKLNPKYRSAEEHLNKLIEE